MSRIGKQPIIVPDGVKVAVSGCTVNIDGPKGKLSNTFHQDMSIDYRQQEKNIIVKRNSDEKKQRALHGLTRSLIANMIQGVTKGYSKKLEIVGLGYTAKVQGKDVVFSLGYTHPIQMQIPAGVKIDVTNPTNPVKLTVSGPDKQIVGQFSAVIRGKKPPEPYKGMGIKYENEVIRRKAGKAFTSGAA